MLPLSVSFSLLLLLAPFTAGGPRQADPRSLSPLHLSLKLGFCVASCWDGRESPKTSLQPCVSILMRTNCFIRFLWIPARLTSPATLVVPLTSSLHPGLVIVPISNLRLTLASTKPKEICKSEGTGSHNALQNQFTGSHPSVRPYWASKSSALATPRYSKSPVPHLQCLFIALPLAPPPQPLQSIDNLIDRS